VSRRTQFAYVADQELNVVFGFEVGKNGELTPLNPPSVPADNGTLGVVVDPGKRFLYAVNAASSDVSGYAIGQDGSLTPAPGSPYPAGSGAEWITVDPKGTFVYTANCGALCSGTGEGNVSAFAMDQQTGALTPVPGSPFQAGDLPYAIVVDRKGEFAYTVNFGSNDITIFRIDRASGALSPVGPAVQTGGITPILLQLDPHGRFLYVDNLGSISAFAIGHDGMLTSVPGSPFAAGCCNQGIAFDEHARFLYAANGTEVLGFSIEANGALTPLPASPFPTPGSGFLASLTRSERGPHIYGAAAFDGLEGFNIDEQTGNLTPAPGFLMPLGAMTSFVTTVVEREPD
jgi:6-phosphogluconolactonase (cycloisomerase 2 family)